jgi:hypothetical protein
MHRRRFEMTVRTAGYTFTVSVITCIMSCQFKDLLVRMFPVRSDSGTTIVSLIDTCYVAASEVVRLFNAGLQPSINIRHRLWFSPQTSRDVLYNSQWVWGVSWLHTRSGCSTDMALSNCCIPINVSLHSQSVFGNHTFRVILPLGFAFRIY